MRLVLFLSLPAVMAVIVGCGTTAPTNGSASSKTCNGNAVCPLSGKVINPAVPTREYNGGTVCFCCPHCPQAWDKLSDDQKKAKLAAAVEKQSEMVANNRCPVMNSPVDKSAGVRVFEGKVVGFCCSGCASAWDKLSDDQKREKLAAAMK